MNPYDYVNSQFTMPFRGYKFQEDAINRLATLQNQGHYLAMGCGKSYTATMSALYQLVKDDAQHAIVLMPPILIDGWLRFLSSIPEVKALAYRGTPAQRRDLPLGHHEFTLMSYQIFKGDYEYIESKFRNRRVIVISDEATAIKNIASANHKKFVNFTQGRSRALLTGSPLSNPMDAYAYCKLVAPGVYRNMNQFKNIHVAEVDFFGTVTKWRELDLLAQNMKVNSVRITAEEALKDLPEVTYNVMPYRLAPAHMRLYRQLADEQLLLMQDGGKIDATSSTRLYNALQQIILNWDHFGQDPKLTPEGLTLLDEVLAQCQGEKLVVCANYRMSNRMLLRYLKRYNAVAIYGENSSTQNRKSVDDFIDKDEVKVCIIQPTSGGYGVDGLQEVCRDMLFLEAPTVPRDFHQTVARLRRNGQKFNTNVRIAVAQGTIQMRLHENLLRNDELVNRVVPSAADLREAIYGG